MYKEFIFGVIIQMDGTDSISDLPGLKYLRIFSFHRRHVSFFGIELVVQRYKRFKSVKLQRLCIRQRKRLSILVAFNYK